MSDAAELRRALVAAGGAERLQLALLALRDMPYEVRLAALASKAVLQELRRVLGRGVDAQDDAQEVILKLHTSLRGARLETPAASRSWLRRVAHSVRVDRHRRRTRASQMQQRLKNEQAVSASVRAAPMDAPETEPAPIELERWRVELFERIDSVLAGRQQRTRIKGRLYAECAWKRHVRSMTREAISRELAEQAPAKADTLSQWINRGRNDFILPTLRVWRASLGPSEDEDIVQSRVAVDALLTFFEQAKRGDAGKPRPARGRNVSPESHRTSVQVEDDGVLPQDGPDMDEEADG